ncbi:MAG: hypothetical protein GYB68_17245 [Chloroflexi bacterium]|nr:hypothetical protein [Chloroflexota bacterium]
MAIQVDERQDQRIIIIAFSDEGSDSVEANTREAAEALEAFVEVVGKPVVRILVFDETIKFGQIVRGLATDLLDAGIGQDREIETVMVGSQTFLKAVATGLEGHSQYGPQSVALFTLLEEALSYAETGSILSRRG